MQIAFAMPTKMPPKYCVFCETEVEDKVHFLCFCPLYKELRQKYIHRERERERERERREREREILIDGLILYKSDSPLSIEEIIKQLFPKRARYVQRNA